MAVFQRGIDVSRYQGSINWPQVAASGVQFAMVRIGSSNNSGLYVDPYFLQNVSGAHAAGLRVGAYYYSYARSESAVIDELTLFLNALEGLQLEYPVFVDVEDSSQAALGRAQLTGLVRIAMDILYQRGWYAGWYSYTNFIKASLNAGELAAYPLWLADYRSQPGFDGPYAMWQYSASGSVSGVTGACDLNYSYTDFLPTLQAGNFNGYGSSGPQMEAVQNTQLVVFGAQTEYFYTANFNDVVGYLPVGRYEVTQKSAARFNGYDWVIFRYQGGEYWTALLGDRNRLETVSECQQQLSEARAKIDAARAALA